MNLIIPIENTEAPSHSPLNVFTLPTSKLKTCVLIDDDQMVADIWKEEAIKAKVNLVVYKSPRDASVDLMKFDKQVTEFYVDVNFRGEILGLSFAQKLRELGFKRVSLSTAYPGAAFTGLREIGVTVSGKEPPWAV